VRIRTRIIKAKAYSLQLFEVPRAALQVGLLDTLGELLGLPLTIRRKGRRVLLGNCLVLLFSWRGFGAATKEHGRDAMADCRTDSNGACSGCHLREHTGRLSRGLRLRRSRGVRGWRRG
jgi:hypothetical protein